MLRKKRGCYKYSEMNLSDLVLIFSFLSFLGILVTNWLPNSSIKLYQLFPSDLLEQMRIKLEILKDLVGSESQYATVEVKNGRFCKFDL